MKKIVGISGQLKVVVQFNNSIRTIDRGLV